MARFPPERSSLKVTLVNLSLFRMYKSFVITDKFARTRVSAYEVSSVKFPDTSLREGRFTEDTLRRMVVPVVLRLGKLTLKLRPLLVISKRFFTVSRARLAFVSRLLLVILTLSAFFRLMPLSVLRKVLLMVTSSTEEIPLVKSN